MQQTCKNCKFYTPRFDYSDKFINGNRGECKKIIEEYIEKVKDTDSILFEVGGHYDSVAVGKDFGCIHFKFK